MLRFQTVSNLLPARAAEAKSLLDDALDRADSALAESRSAIQNLRSTPARDANLAEAIHHMAAVLAEEHRQEGRPQPVCSVVVEGVERPLHPWVNVEILRIAQECLRNAQQHAGASRIEAELNFEESHLRLRFRDDGVGIDAEVLRNGSRLGHWGLIGMKERAAQIGAKLEVWSKPGAGTELELSIPGHVAYDRQKAPGLLQKLRKRIEERHDLRSSHHDSDR